MRSTTRQPPGLGQGAGPLVAWLLLAGGLTGLVVVTEWVRLPVPDVAWLLHVTDRVAHGARYGLDVADVAPPPIIWYSLAPVVVAEWVGITRWHAFMVMVLLTAAGALFLMWALARRSRACGPKSALVVLAAGALALVAFPWGGFGEREHVTLILVTPYVLLFALRDDDVPVPTGLALWAGVFAGFGFAIKPHFAIPWALLGATALWRGRGWPLLRRAEFLAACGVGVLCVLSVLRFEADYISYMRRFAALYLDYVPRNPFFVALVGESNWAIVVLLAVLTAAVLWERVPNQARPTALYFLVGAVGFHAVAALQLKGWRYHYLPGVALSSILLMVLIANTRSQQHRLVERVYRVAGLATLTVLCGSLVLGNMARLRGTVGTTFDPDYEQTLNVVRRFGGGRPLAVLSANLASAFPLGSEAGVEWAFRYGGLPWLPAFYASEVRTGKIVTYRPYVGRSVLERSFAEDVVTDLRRAVPGLIIVPQPANDGSYYRLFDYLGYFGEEPGFGEFFEAYRLLGRTGAYQVFQHQDLADTSGFMAQAGTDPGATRMAGLSDLESGLVLAALVSAVVLGIGAWERQRRPTGAQ